MQAHISTYLRTVLLLSLSLFFHVSVTAQEIWGMTKYGGEYDKGVIFKMDENASNQEVVYSFETIQRPEGGMTEFTQDIFYGLTAEGGKHDFGVLYKFEAASGKFTKIIDFDGAGKGKDGAGRMVLASNGKMYGMTVNGGTHDLGVIFEFNPETESYAKKIDFNGQGIGSEPLGNLIEGDDGKLYGVTSTGGVYESGVLFAYDISSNQVTKLQEFSGSVSGSNPMGSLMKASDGLMYGMTRWGGAGDNGIIFSYNPVTNMLTSEFEFDGLTTGRHPQGDLIEASNGKIYGLTPFGGLYESGVLFEYDFQSDIFSPKFQFTGGLGGGTSSYGSLVEAGNNKLYGLLESDLHMGDMLFEFDPLNADYKVMDWAESFPREFTMFGKSLSFANSGKLYFVINANQNDIINENNLYEFNPEDNAFSGHLRFSGIETGEFPHGSLCQGTNGMLYGTTYTGGAYHQGVIFKIDPETNSFTKLIDFDREQKGARPHGGLVQAGNRKFYGLTSEGGAYNKGVIYELNPDNDELVKIFDFDGVNGQGPDGDFVKGANGKLYGTTPSGGANNEGVLFELDPETGTFHKMLDFQSGLYGKEPLCNSLVATSNGFIYGTTLSGGATDEGVIFEFNPETGTYTKVIEFNGSLGKVPAHFTQGADNKLYAHVGSDKLVSFDPASYNYSVELDECYLFNPVAGKLLQAENGKFYAMDCGLIWYRATDFNGGIHEFDVNGGSYSQLLEFSWVNGSNPQNSSLIQLKDITEPVAQCKDITLYLDENGQAALEPEDIDNGSTGDAIQFSVDVYEFDCDDVGENQVVLTVTDGSGNSSECEAIVTIIDNVPPQIICPVNLSARLEPYEPEYVIEGAGMDATATDNCGIESIIYTVNGTEGDGSATMNGYVLSAGTYEVEWTAADMSGNVTLCTSEIFIEKRPSSLQIRKNEMDGIENTANLEVVLMDEILGNGIVGKTILFTGEGFTESAVTNDEGVAIISVAMGDEVAGGFVITAEFVEDDTYTGSRSEAEIITSFEVVSALNVRVYPNPFSEKLTFEFISPATADATIDVYDPAGRLVKNVFRQPVESGRFYRVEYLPDFDNGSYLLYRMEIGKLLHSGKVMYSK